MGFWRKVYRKFVVDFSDILDFLGEPVFCRVCGNRVITMDMLESGPLHQECKATKKGVAPPRAPRTKGPN